MTGAAFLSRTYLHQGFTVGSACVHRYVALIFDWTTRDVNMFVELLDIFSTFCALEYFLYSKQVRPPHQHRNKGMRASADTVLIHTYLKEWTHFYINIQAIPPPIQAR